MWGILTAFRPGEGGIWTIIFKKVKCPGGFPGGGMLKLRFDRYITNMLNNVGLKLRPCLTPTKGVNVAVGPLLTLFKSDLFYSNWPNTQVLQTETIIAILLLHCSLGDCNKETCCVLWFFFCIFLKVVSIKNFCPKLRKQFASKFLWLCSILDTSGLHDTTLLFQDDLYRDFFLTLRRGWVRVTEAQDWSDPVELSIPGGRNNQLGYGITYGAIHTRFKQLFKFQTFYLQIEQLCINLEGKRMSTF